MLILFGVGTLCLLKIASVNTFTGSVLKRYYILRAEELGLPLSMLDASTRALTVRAD